MIKDGQNIKDTSQDSIKDTSYLPTTYTGGELSAGSYTKTNKLITALYMVTDIMDQKEPLRTKLRTLGAEIVSDVYALSINPSIYNSTVVMSKISETMSFLDIATTINLVSQMNSNILKKEFLQLRKSIENSFETRSTLNSGFRDFFKEEISEQTQTMSSHSQFQTQGHAANVFSQPTIPTRLGVQKGSTLMKAISDRTSFMSDRNITRKEDNGGFDVLKKQRRNEIISIIKGAPNNSGATITDIKSKAKGSLATLGEKTLQRELISMLKDNILKKTGEKRWSRYFLA